MAKIKNPVTIVQQSGGSGGENKLAKLVDGSITTITAEDLAGITSIRAWAFYNYVNLASVAIPDSVTNIGQASFQGCTSLTSVTIPSSVTSIEDGAFQSCSNLTTITVLAITPPAITIRSFINDTNIKTIYIPAGTLSAYQSANVWSGFIDKFVELSE